jgi:hypothetical protein
MEGVEPRIGVYQISNFLSASAVAGLHCIRKGFIYRGFRKPVFSLLCALDF